MPAPPSSTPGHTDTRQEHSRPRHPVPALINHFSHSLLLFHYGYIQHTARQPAIRRHTLHRPPGRITPVDHPAANRPPAHPHRSRRQRQEPPGPATGNPAAAPLCQRHLLVRPGPLSDPANVPQAVAASLHIAEEPAIAISESLVRALRQRQLLLILDNCEHLLAACAALASRLHRDCPQLTLLATSLQPLGLPAEIVWPVPPSPSRTSAHPPPWPTATPCSCS